MSLGRTHFVLGGARSGKSLFAEGLVAASGLAPVYLATGEAGDEEMRERIRTHRERRPPDWRTVDEPLDLVEALEAQAAPDRALLVDCLTLWISNLMMAGREVDADGERLAALLQAPLPGLVVFVSNEVGLSVVPDNAVARRFRDAAGRLHQQVAAACDRVTFVAAGLPLHLKG